MQPQQSPQSWVQPQYQQQLQWRGQDAFAQQQLPMSNHFSAQPFNPRAYDMHRAPGQWPPEQQQQQQRQQQLHWNAQQHAQQFRANPSLAATTAPYWGADWGKEPPDCIGKIPCGSSLPVLRLGEERPRTRVPQSARFAYSAREQALSMIRQLKTTMDNLEQQGDVSGVTSLNAYAESLESKFGIDFPD